MLQAYFIVQLLDTGEFVSCEDGQLVYAISLARARTFQTFEVACNYARDIDPTFETVTVHQVWLPTNYQPLII